MVLAGVDEHHAEALLVGSGGSTASMNVALKFEFRGVLHKT